MTTAQVESVQTESAQVEPPVVFQALGCLQGVYTPLLPNCLQGTLTTPDGVQFSAALRSSVKGYLKHKFGVLEPDQPFQPDGKLLRWKVYPKVEVDGSLHLQIMLVVAEFYRLPPDEFTITGLLTQQDEQEQSVSIRVYRNTPGDKYHPSLSPQFFPLQFAGYLPDLKVDRIVKLSAHREGTKLAITEARGVTMNLDERVKRDIEQFLHPRKPLPPPVKRPLTEAAQLEVVQLTTVVVEHTEINMLTPVQSVVIPTPPLGPLTSAIGPVEPESVATPQPEPRTISVSGASANTLNTPTELPAAVPNPPTIPAAKSKKKKQAIPTPAATVPMEKKPEVAQRPKPKFLVQVDRQTFGGQSSVVLKAGMLLIDGKPIVRTKLAIVVGEPQTISADGKTQKSGNRTILSSR